MDHYHNSRYRGALENSDFFTSAKSPSCADHVIFEGLIRENKIDRCVFRGEGSILGMAVASMLCEKIIGMDINDVLKIQKNDLLELIGVDLGPTRLRTLLFILQTLQKGIDCYVKSHQSS